jgi:predicted nucleic acid-binding protein
MSYLLDTNVVSEMTRRRPDQRVVRWLDSVPNTALHISVLTVGEIRSGVEVRQPSAKKERLRLWLEQEIPAWFEQRLLPVDAAVADRWGRLVAAARRPLPAIDSLLAATALVYGLRLATRNVKHFELPGLELINPWGE